MDRNLSTNERDLFERWRIGEKSLEKAVDKITIIGFGKEVTDQKIREVIGEFLNDIVTLQGFSFTREKIASGEDRFTVYRKDRGKEIVYFTRANPFEDYSYN